MEVDNRMSRAMEKGQHGEKQELKVEVPGTSKRSVSPHQHPESPSGRGATSGSIHSLRALEASVKRLASLSSKSSTYDPPDSSGHFLVTGQPFSGHNHAVPSEAVGSRSVPSRQGHWNKGASIDMSDDTFECFPGVTTPRGAGINVPSFHRSASFGSNARRGSATSCKSPGGSILRRACSEVHMQPPILALSWDVGNAKRQPSPMGERCASPELMSASKCQALQSPCIVRESGVSQRRRSIDFDLALCISKNSECEQFAKRNDRWMGKLLMSDIDATLEKHRHHKKVSDLPTLKAKISSDQRGSDNERVYKLKVAMGHCNIEAGKLAGAALPSPVLTAAKDPKMAPTLDLESGHALLPS